MTRVSEEEFWFLEDSWRDEYPRQAAILDRLDNKPHRIMWRIYDAIVQDKENFIEEQQV